MLRFASLLLIAAIVGAPLSADRQARAAEPASCRPAKRDSSGFGLVGQVGGGRVALCGDLLLRVIAPKVLPKLPGTLTTPVTTKSPAEPVVHPKGWVNRWASTIAVRPARGLLRIAAQHQSGHSLRVSLQSNAVIHYKRGWLLGRAIVVRFTPSSVNWFVDHVRQRGSRDRTESVKLGRVHGAYIETNYAAAVRLANSAVWAKQRGVIRVVSNRVWFGANSTRAPSPTPRTRLGTYFVNGDCRQEPTALGC